MKARIVIPVWGAKYIERLARLCLPALLAPGNLPHLAKHFECELTIVTESKLFDMVRALPVIQEAGAHCTLRLVSLDDVLSHQAHYGYTITHALFRGFSDLGEAAKDAWFLFLNADFILADGSYVELAKRMLAGEHVIFAPSYCAIEENVFPAMAERRLPGSRAVAIPPREMAGLILDNRHFTIRSKIINWRMYRIDRVDQFYYVVDNDTMLGRQLPIAVVAFRPTRVPPEPVTFWDYGIVAEVCPDCTLSVIGDSDQFLMMELRGERTMSEQFELGWMDKDAIARDLTIWTTKDQRDSGEFPLVLHRADLPPTVAEGERVLEEYYRDVMSRVSPKPLDHLDHYIWRDVIRLHAEWQRERAWTEALEKARQGDPASAPAGAGWRWFDLARGAYRKLFGRVPEVGRMHPLWADLHPVMSALQERAPQVRSALCLTSRGGGMIAPYLSRWLPKLDRVAFADLLDDTVPQDALPGAPYDFCFAELVWEEFLQFREVHARLRRYVRKGGTILVFFRPREPHRIAPRDFKMIAGALPGCDVAELRFSGSPMLRWLQRLWDRETQKLGRGRAGLLLGLAMTGAFVGPLAYVANARVAGRAPGELPPGCTSLVLDIRVI